MTLDDADVELLQKLGAMIESADGSTFENDPPDAIIVAAITLIATLSDALGKCAAENTQLKTERWRHEARAVSITPRS